MPSSATQGSTLSALLCNLYLADLENTHIQPLLPSSRSGNQGSGAGSGSAAGYLSALAAEAAAVAAQPASSSQPQVKTLHKGTRLCKPAASRSYAGIEQVLSNSHMLIPNPSKYLDDHS